jgi:hypothetical protein
MNTIISHREVLTPAGRFDIPPGGFEPPSPAPKAGMIDRYTTGVWQMSFNLGLFYKKDISSLILFFKTKIVISCTVLSSFPKDDQKKTRSPHTGL